MTRTASDYYAVIKAIEGGAVTNKNIAQAVHLSKATMNDILTLLRNKGFVVRLPGQTYHVWKMPTPQELERIHRDD